MSLCRATTQRPDTTILVCDLPAGHDGPHQDSRPPGVVREEAMLRLRAEGRTLDQIATLFGISRSRAQQICSRGRARCAERCRRRLADAHRQTMLDRWPEPEPVTAAERIALRYWFEHGGAAALASVRSDAERQRLRAEYLAMRTFE